jgi:Tol biopolymer transport system component
VWYEAHDLMVWDPGAHTSRRVAGVSGASVPVWSRNGKDLLFVNQDALWLVAVAAGAPVEVADPLYSEAQWQSAYKPDGDSLGTAYYGQIPWRVKLSPHTLLSRRAY